MAIQIISKIPSAPLTKADSFWFFQVTDDHSQIRNFPTAQKPEFFLSVSPILNMNSAYQMFGT